MGRGCRGGKVEAVLTCQGDIHDPGFPTKCQQIFNKLQALLDNKDLDVTKCEPWNSVKVTFNIPKDAAEKLASLAEAGDHVLKELGILSIQVEGGQVISMTMVEDNSDSDGESTSTPTPTKSSPLKDTPVKEGLNNALLSPADLHGFKSTNIRNFGSSGSRTNIGSNALLTSPGSSFSHKSSSEQSVLSTLGGPQTTKDGLLASLVASRTAGKSDLFNVKDSDEPVAKKARKVEGVNKSSDNNLGYTFSKYGGSGSGFTILPVNSALSGAVSTASASGSNSTSSAASSSSRSTSSSSGGSSVTASGSHSSSAGSVADPLSGSSVKLANLPGVSLTSVSRANMSNLSSGGSRTSAASSSSGGSVGGGLMPPPSSSVTLSPVPRQTNPSLVNSSNNDRLSESDPSKGTSSSSSSSKPGSKSSTTDSATKLSLLSNNKDFNNKQTFLINPITGQFEMGPPEPDPDASAPDQSKPASGDSGSASKSNSSPAKSETTSKIKVETGQTSPGGEPSLKLKLKVSGSKVSKESTITSSPQSGGKLPKLKIKLKEKSVELESSSSIEDSLDSSSPITSALPPQPSASPSEAGSKPHDGSSSGSSSPGKDATMTAATSHVQLDLKTRVRIKPLPEKMRDKSEGHHGHYSNNQINHISVDTINPEKRKKSGCKDKKGDKNRLKIWTDSLAKHAKREDSGTKDTKRWPEVLENRLFVQGGAAQHSNQSNKLETNKNLDKDDKARSDQEEESSNDNHLNWAGPGREEGVALPGPGPIHPLSPHPVEAGENPAANNKQSQPDSPNSASSTDQLLPSATNSSKPPGGLSTVLDILEGRRALGEPVSPLTGPHHHTDQSGHQGEDSGIESGDTLSEKSPNQGESPFHASAASAEGMERMPTYSSSVVGSVSGKLSPPVSDSGSTDSMVTATPPDKSPNTGQSLPSAHQNGLECGEGGKGMPEHNSTSSIQNETPSATDQSSSLNCDSHPSTNINISTHNSESSCSSSNDSKAVSTESSINKSVISSQSNALTNNTVTPSSNAGAHISSQKSVSIVESQVKLPSNTSTSTNPVQDSSVMDNTHNQPVETTTHSTDSSSNSLDNRLQQSTITLGESSADDSNTLLTTTTPSTTTSSSSSLVCIAANPTQVQRAPPEPSEGGIVEEPETDLIRSCDGADDKVSPDLLEMEARQGESSVDGIFVKKDSVITALEDNTECLKQPQPVSSTASTTSKTMTSTILLTTGSVSNKVVTIATPAFISSASGSIVSSTTGISSSISVTTLSAATGGTNQLTQLRPGAKMVPVKLVSVPGHGGAMRMVRVSPVKGAEIAASTASLPPRTVVIKSSLLRPVTCSNIISSNSNCGSSNNSSTDSSSSKSDNPAATNSTVQFPAPNPSSSICDSIVPPVHHPQESPALSRLKDDKDGNSLEGEVNRLSSPLPPDTNTATSQAAPVKRQASSTSPKISNNQLKPQGDSDQDLISKSHQQLPPLESRLDEVEEDVKPLPHPVAIDKSDKGFFEGNNDLTPVHPQRTVPVLTNGDTANAEITDLKTLSSARRARNGNGSIKPASNGSDLNGDIDLSLLKPLITSSTTTVASVIVKDDFVSEDAVVNLDVPEIDTPTREASPQDPSSVSPPPGGVLLPPATGKRSRRDTGSSVQSDRSDLSAVSNATGVGAGTGEPPAAKRAKDEKGGRRGSTSPGAREPSSRIQDRRKPEDASNQLNSENKSNSVNKKKNVKAEPAKKSSAGVLANGAKHNTNPTPKPKVSAVADKTKATPKADKKTTGPKNPPKATTGTNAGAAKTVNKNAAGGGATTGAVPNSVGSVKSAGTGGKSAVEKVVAGDAGRRVSARVKKPDEKSTETKRKR